MDTNETPQQPIETATTLDLDAKVKVGGDEIPIRDLASAREELAKAREEMERLSQFRDAALTIMRQDLNPDAKMEAARQILADAGLPQEEIDRQVAGWVGAQGEEEMVDENDQVEEEYEEDDDDEDVEVVAQAIREAQERAAQAEDEVRRIKAERMGNQMSSEIQGALDGISDARTLMSKLRELNGDEAAKNARAAIERDIRQTTLDNLRARRDAAGAFSETWVAEEAKRAAEAVVAKYRSVIGDPNRLGRAPETDSGVDYLVSRKPVPQPKWKPGMRYGDVEGQLQAFNTDALTRLASGLDTGGDKV